MPHSLPSLPLIAFAVVAFIATIFILSRGGSKTPDDDRRIAELVHMALMAKQRGNHEGAEELLRKAVDTFSETTNPHFAMHSSSVLSLAQCLAQNGKYEEARAMYAKLIEIWKEALKKPQPEALTDIDYAAASNDFSTSANEAAELYPEVIAAKRKLYGPYHPEVVNSMIVHSKLLHRVGRIEEAEAVDAEAKSLQAKQGG